MAWFALEGLRGNSQVFSSGKGRAVGFAGDFRGLTGALGGRGSSGDLTLLAGTVASPGRASKGQHTCTGLCRPRSDLASGAISGFGTASRGLNGGILITATQATQIYSISHLCPLVSPAYWTQHPLPSQNPFTLGTIR